MHLDDELKTILSSIETSLIQSGDVRVVARSRQDALADEIGRQNSAMFDASTAQSAGRQLGAQFFVTGRVTAVDERLSGKRRVQYSLFMQVLEVETGVLLWQNESTRTKAMRR